MKLMWGMALEITRVQSSIGRRHKTWCRDVRHKPSSGKSGWSMRIVTGGDSGEKEIAKIRPRVSGLNFWRVKQSNGGECNCRQTEEATIEVDILRDPRARKPICEVEGYKSR
jgi:hypothetical protein